uniref:Aminopeptidase N n=1 Tax=Leptobrachium leishanense TaxID=445787 RepID=A0A8C5M7X5_9ANUR
MAKGFYISKVVGFVGIFFTLAAVATVIALAVLYAEEKAKKPEPTSTTTSGTSSSISPTITTPQTSDEPWTKYRLPDTFKPYHYDVRLKTDLQRNSQGLYVFYGKSEAFFTCVKATNLVIIHSNKLNFTTDPKALLKDSAGNNLTVSQIHEVPLTQYLVLHAANSLEVNKNYSVYTEFVGELADDLAGFYRSEYVEDGETKIIATTQMQATDARKAFPCFDEPAMKATFSIIIVHNPEYVALSNMNAISKSEDEQTWTETAFAKTVKMPTYLVAFIISQFKAIGDPGNSTTVGVSYLKHGVLHIYIYITIRFSESYFYPADQVAIPDFGAGAMENWGLVLYRETALLYDNQVSSISNKERVAEVVAHELAHQWFGNLVTIRWWNDLWLNEGFASYVEYLGVDKAEPNWNIVCIYFFLEKRTHFSQVNTPAEISELFDSITYNKVRSYTDLITASIRTDLKCWGKKVHDKWSN